MDFPNRFDIPTFPAGRTIALSRSIAMWFSIVCVLICVVSGFVIYGKSVKQNFPFLISVDPITNEWDLIAYPRKKAQRKISQNQIIQEKLVNDYVKNWFTISGNNERNEEKWQECTIDECAEPEQYNPYNTQCALFCMSGTELFENFLNNVLPEYRERVAQANERWNIVYTNIKLNSISENSSHWQVYMVIKSTINGLFDVLSFVDIKRNTELYPATLGYYVDDFNAYRMSIKK